MGRTKASRLKGDCQSVGPLWCVPITPEVCAVWGSFPPDSDLLRIDTPLGPVEPLERHRIFSSQFATVLFVLPIRGLQDGQKLDVILRDSAGGESSCKMDFRLANWRAPGAPQVVAFIVTRILPAIQVAAAHATVGRFLSLMSSWRVAGEYLADLGDYAVYGLDVSAGFFSDQHGCIAIVGPGLIRAIAGTFEAGGKTVFILPRNDYQRAFTDLDGDLVQFDLSNLVVTEQDSVAWLRGLSPDEQNALIDRLSWLSAQDQGQCPSWVASSLKKAQMPLAEPGAALSVAGAFLTTEELFVFVGLNGSAPFRTIDLELFGSAGAERISPELMTWASTADDGLPERRIVARTVLAEGKVPLACLIVVEVEGQTIRQWVKVQPAGLGGCGLSLARTFWPLAEEDERYVSEVAVPLARAWAQAPTDGTVVALAPRRSADTPCEVDLQVVCEDGLERLSPTLVGLRASIRREQGIRLTLPGDVWPHEARRELARQLRHYAFDAEIELAPSHAPMAVLARPSSRNSGSAWVALRAGFIPSYGGWLDEAVTSLRQNPSTVLVGLAPGRVAHTAHETEIPPQAIPDLLGNDAIVAVAASQDLAGLLPVAQPVCHSLTGAWAEWLCEIIARGGTVLRHQALDFLDTDASHAPGLLSARVDGINLSHKIAQRAREGLSAHHPILVKSAGH